MPGMKHVLPCQETLCFKFLIQD